MKSLSLQAPVCFSSCASVDITACVLSEVYDLWMFSCIAAGILFLLCC